MSARQWTDARPDPGQPVVVAEQGWRRRRARRPGRRTGPCRRYTLLLGSNSHLIQKHLSPDLKFDPIGEFAPVTRISTSPTVLVVEVDYPAKDMHALIALAKSSLGR